MSGKKAKLLRKAMRAPVSTDRAGADVSARDGVDADEKYRQQILARTRAYRGMKRMYRDGNIDERRQFTEKMQAAVEKG
jgi:hypothetical protein